jgi:hypothetical protein
MDGEADNEDLGETCWLSLSRTPGVKVAAADAWGALSDAADGFAIDENVLSELKGKGSEISAGG